MYKMWGLCYKKGQVSLELMWVMAFFLILYGAVTMETIFKTGQRNTLIEEYKQKVVCNQLANAITDAYTLRDGSETIIELKYRYNLKIFGPEGFISIGDDPEGEVCPYGCVRTGIGCRFPIVIMEESPEFTDEEIDLRIYNEDEMVYVEAI